MSIKYHINPETMKAGVCKAQAGNCRFKIDEAEHFSNKAEANQAIEDKLSEKNNFVASVKKDLQEEVNLKNYSKINIQPFDETELENETHRLEGLVQAKDESSVLSTIESRGNDEEFQGALAQRDALYTLSMSLEQDVKSIRSRKGFKYTDLKEAILKVRGVNEHLAALNNAIHEYRGVTARYAEAYSELRETREREEGRFLTYENETIGSLVADAEYASGSPEWHAQRQSGIGGSDVGKIMMVDKKYGVREYRDLLLKKVGLDDVNDTDDFRNDYNTAVGRGNAWEETIRHMYADRNPDKNVAFCKTSWEGVGDEQYKHANFDGLELDENGKPYGIIEIKTGIHTDKWGSTDDGYAGMPEGYRKQALWYANNAGLKEVTLVAVLDDYDYREYKFSMSDPRAQAEVKEIEKATRSFWNTVENHKKELSEGVDTLTNKPVKGFAQTIDKKRVAKNLAVYTGLTPSKALERVNTVMKNVDRKDREAIQTALTKLYAEHDPATRKRPLMGIDIETNSPSEAKGRIIETGIVSLNNDGSTKVEYSSLHGVSDKVMRGAAAGDERIHKINSSMISGKKPFEDPDTQKEILKQLKRGTLVAHNASFEKKWLAVNLDGFAEALDKGQVRILDTKQIASHLMTDSEDNSLRSFSEDNGVAYEGAHAATTDTRMMMEALGNFRSNLHKNGKVVKQEVTEAEREEALRNIER